MKKKAKLSAHFYNLIHNKYKQYANNNRKKKNENSRHKWLKHKIYV